MNKKQLESMIEEKMVYFYDNGDPGCEDVQRFILTEVLPAVLKSFLIPDEKLKSISDDTVSFVLKRINEYIKDQAKYLYEVII